MCAFVSITISSIKDNETYTWAMFDVDTPPSHYQLKVPPAIKDQGLFQLIFMLSMNKAFPQCIYHLPCYDTLLTSFGMIRCSMDVCCLFVSLTWVLISKILVFLNLSPSYNRLVCLKS